MKGLDPDWEKIRSYFNNENSDKNNEYLNDLFSDESKEDGLKSYFHRHFYEFFAEEDLERKDLDHILYKVHFDINCKSLERKGYSFNHFLKWTLRIAGLIILPVLIYIGTGIYKDYFSNKEAWVEINSPAWTRTQFRLPDGTVGWLNSNSSIRYSGNFTEDRQVTMKGEAYFDVFKDEKTPFVVKTNDVAIKVLGTKFNVTAYENEKDIEVILEEGSLVFNQNNKSDIFQMKPGDMVLYDKLLHNTSVELVQPNKYTAWTQGKLVFRNDPIDVIARRLERFYNVDVEVVGKVEDNMRLRATFIDEDLEEVLTWMKKSLPLSYRIENGTIMSDDIYARKKVIINLQTN
jgi:hypothetical protein